MEAWWPGGMEHVGMAAWWHGGMAGGKTHGGKPEATADADRL